MFRMDHVYGSRRDLKMSPFKHVRKWPKKRHYRPKLWENALFEILLSRIEAGTLSNLVFSDEKKFDVQHHVNPQNDRVWSCGGEVGPRRVTRVQGTASVMVWEAVTQSVRSPLVFVEQGVKLNQENYQNDILVGSLLPWAKEHFKKRSRTFQRDSAPSHGAKKTQEWLYQPMFPTSFPKRNGPLHHPI